MAPHDLNRTTKRKSSRSQKSKPIWFRRLAKPWILLLLFASLLGFLALAVVLVYPYLTAGTQNEAPVVQEIRYKMPEAGEVFLVWGVNGWNATPEEAWPEGTRLEDGVMNTPMKLEGDTFVARVQANAWEKLSFIFSIRKSKDGSAVEVVERNDEKPFEVLLSEQGGVTEVQSKVTVGSELAAQEADAEQLNEAPLVTQEIRYQMPEAGKVLLLWGVNGWMAMPEETWPEGTWLKDGVMHTPMTPAGDWFIINVPAPVGTTLRFGFLVTRSKEGAEAELYEVNGEEPFQVLVTEQGGLTQVQSKMSLQQAPVKGLESGTGGTVNQPITGPKVTLFIAFIFLGGLLFIFIIGFVFRRSSA